LPGLFAYTGERKMENIMHVEKSQRVVTFLNRREVDYLDKMGKDALFSSGIKISRAKIIAWLVNFMEQLNISGKGIKSEMDFKNRMMDSIPPATQDKSGGAR
jgi:hypothetical protein